MRRILVVLAAIVGGVALLGAGLVVGSRMGQEHAQIAAANAQGAISDKDLFVLPTFTDASTRFESLLGKAKDGKEVGAQLTQQAVIVVKVGDAAEGEVLKKAAEESGQAMLLLSAGVVADDGPTVDKGFKAYQKAQESISELAAELRAMNGDPESEESEGTQSQGTQSQGTQSQGTESRGTESQGEEAGNE